MKRLFKKLGKKTINQQPFDYAQGRTEPAEVQKTRLSASSLNNSGSEFPSVTEQTSLVSETLGRALSDSFRSIILTLASTFIGDGLSTSIISPTDSSATLPSNYQSSTESANLSRSIKKALITEGSFGSVENSFIEETLSTRINNIIPQKAHPIGGKTYFDSKLWTNCRSTKGKI